MLSGIVRRLAASLLGEVDGGEHESNSGADGHCGRLCSWADRGCGWWCWRRLRIRRIGVLHRRRSIRIRTGSACSTRTEGGDFVEFGGEEGGGVRECSKVQGSLRGQDEVVLNDGSSTATTSSRVW